MDANSFTQLISNVGFPIAAYAALFFWMMKISKSQEEQIDRLTEVVMQNTNAIDKLSEKVGGSK